MVRGPAIKRAFLLVAIGTVIVGLRPATADPARGPFQVMGPDGTVVLISSEAADAWWRDYHESRCVTCRGPHQAAELLDAVEDGLGGRFRAAPRYLIVVEALQTGWSRAWVFYPSSDETPAYVMHPGGVGSGMAPLRWDAWFRATSRMERIILQGCAPPPRPRLRGRSKGSVESGRARASGSPPPRYSRRSSRLSRSLGAGARRRRAAAAAVGSRGQAEPFERKHNFSVRGQRSLCVDQTASYYRELCCTGCAPFRRSLLADSQTPATVPKNTPMDAKPTTQS
jgi:hypothetical protein